MNARAKTLPGKSNARLCFVKILPALCAALVLLAPMAARAAAKAKPAPAIVRQSGGLPPSGKVALRCGLAWMNETSPLFQTARAALVPLLAERNLIVVDVPPSTLEPMPSTPFDKSGPPPAELGARPKPAPQAGDIAAAEAKAQELAQQGKLPPLKLQKYSAPDKDSALPPSVMAVRPRDPYVPIFALSQKQGQPLMRRGGAIPGRIPPELTSTDPKLADYTLVLRFTLVRPRPSSQSDLGGPPLQAGLDGLPLQSNPGGPPLQAGISGGTLVAAAGSVQGIGRSGFGSSAPAAPPQPVYGGSDRDYARGYGGTSPNDRDFWNRDSDILSRDYMQRYGEPPQFAAPPAGSPSARSGGAPDGVDLFPPLAGRPVSGSGVLGAALEMECYDLAAREGGGTPGIIWRAVVQRRADEPDLNKYLPEMIRLALEHKPEKKKPQQAGQSQAGQRR